MEIGAVTVIASLDQVLLVLSGGDPDHADQEDECLRGKAHGWLFYNSQANPQRPRKPFANNGLHEPYSRVRTTPSTETKRNTKR